MPSVVCCVFADDIPGENVTGAIQFDETVLAHEKVRAFLFVPTTSGDSAESAPELMTAPLSPQVTCVGHIIGAVVADTQLHAQRAAKAVRIQYEELQPIVTIQVRMLPLAMCWPNRRVVLDGTSIPFFKIKD